MFIVWGPFVQSQTFPDLGRSTPLPMEPVLRAAWHYWIAGRTLRGDLERAGSL